MSKRCRYHPEKRCYRSSCDSLDSMGNVLVCSLFGGGEKFARRKVGYCRASIFRRGFGVRER